MFIPSRGFHPRDSVYYLFLCYECINSSDILKGVLLTHHPNVPFLIKKVVAHYYNVLNNS